MFVYRLKKNTSNVMLTKSNIDQIVSLEIALKKIPENAIKSNI